MHAETSNGDDPFAKVKGLISDMIARLEEKASEDATPKAFEATHIFSSTHSEIEMLRYMTMSQHKDLYLTTSMISFALCRWPEVMNIVLMCDMKIKWIDHSQGVPLDELKRTRQETEDVEENKTKSLITVDMELVAVKHHRAWVDKADENSQSLEMYNAMRQTTWSEREAKDQITEQTSVDVRNEGPKVDARNEGRRLRTRS